MNILIPIIVCIIVAIIFFFIGKSFSKVIKPTSEEILKYSIDNVEFLNELNPLVKDIYLQFIEKDGPKYFQEQEYNILITNMNVEIWKCNTWENRIFTLLPESVLKAYNMTENKLNNSLSLADKKILDHIVNAVTINNKEFISRLFI